jgi:hypothetical protein
MSPYDFHRLYYRARFNTRLFMSRYRVHHWDYYTWTEAELRAAWGDR